MKCPICGKTVIWRPPHSPDSCHCTKGTLIKEIERLKGIITVVVNNMKFHLKHNMSYFGVITVETWMESLEVK